MISQKKIILELYKESNGLHPEEMVKELDCLIRDIQILMMHRVKELVSFTDEQINKLALEIK